MNGWVDLFREALRRWWAHNPGRLAAALAFYSLFSLAPVLIVVTAAAGLVFSEQQARQELAAYAVKLVGPAGAEVVQQVLADAGGRRLGLLLSVAGLITSLVGATAVFAELADGLNQIWGVSSEGSVLQRILRGRIWSFLMLLGMGLLLLALLAAGAVMGAVWRRLGSAPLPALGLLDALASFGLTAVLFAMLFRFLPDAVIGWRGVWAGAGFSAFLFVLGKSAIGYYLRTSTLRSVYGAAGSLAVLLVWVYYSAQILYLGAAFAWAYAARSAANSLPRQRVARSEDSHSQ